MPLIHFAFVFVFPRFYNIYACIPILYIPCASRMEWALNFSSFPLFLLPP
jgi:hypothetical protein